LFWSALERQSKLDQQLIDFAYDTEEFIQKQMDEIDKDANEEDQELADMVKRFFVSAYRIVAMRALNEAIENPKDMYAEGLRFLQEETIARKDAYEADPICTFREIGFAILQRLTTMPWDENAVAQAVKLHSEDGDEISV